MYVCMYVCMYRHTDNIINTANTIVNTFDNRNAQGSMII